MDKCMYVEVVGNNDISTKIFCNKLYLNRNNKLKIQNSIC